MKILWVSNSPIGPAAYILGEEYKGSSGGWIQSEYETLDKINKSFYFLSTLPNVKRGEIFHKKNKIGEVYCVNSPRISYGIDCPTILQENIQFIIDKIEPDIIQIWGTETWLSNAVSKSKTNAKKIVFIQGLIGVHKRYLGGYFGNLSEDKKYIKRKSLIVAGKSLIRKKNFLRQAEIEKETIKNCKNVIVDSDFARAYCTSLTSEVNCFNHILLPNNIFRNYRWNLEDCNRHTIFTVFGSSAEKGTQNLLKAVSIVKQDFPDVKVFIPGIYELDDNGSLLPAKRGSFQNVLYLMIRDYGLVDNISFTGRLNTQQMAETMVKCNVFVNPSCMEVHALSLREAMIEGIPCISTQCGSVAEYLKNKNNGLMYRYEEFETLAYYIKLVFGVDELAKGLSANALGAFDNMKKDDLSMNQIYSILLG